MSSIVYKVHASSTNFGTSSVDLINRPVYWKHVVMYEDVIKHLERRLCDVFGPRALGTVGYVKSEYFQVNGDDITEFARTFRLVIHDIALKWEGIPDGDLNKAKPNRSLEHTINHAVLVYRDLCKQFTIRETEETVARRLLTPSLLAKSTYVFSPNGEFYPREQQRVDELEIAKHMGPSWIRTLVEKQRPIFFVEDLARCDNEKRVVFKDPAMKLTLKDYQNSIKAMDALKRARIKYIIGNPCIGRPPVFKYYEQARRECFSAREKTLLTSAPQTNGKALDGSVTWMMSADPSVKVETQHKIRNYNAFLRLLKTTCTFHDDLCEESRMEVRNKLTDAKLKEFRYMMNCCYDYASTFGGTLDIPEGAVKVDVETQIQKKFV